MKWAVVFGGEIPEDVIAKTCFTPLHYTLSVVFLLEANS
jgi:hypothetical protein